jgi:hypothetical protein
VNDTNGGSGRDNVRDARELLERAREQGEMDRAIDEHAQRVVNGLREAAEDVEQRENFKPLYALILYKTATGFSMVSCNAEGVPSEAKIGLLEIAKHGMSHKAIEG